MRRFRLWSFGLLAAIAALLALGQTTGSTGCWTSPLQIGLAPRLASLSSLPPAEAEECVVWRDGSPIILVPAKAPVPKELPRGEAVKVVLRGPSGDPAPGATLAFRPAAMPNLPEPIGRVKTDAKGEALVYRLPGEELLVWVDDTAHLPMLIHVPPSSNSANIKLVDAPGKMIVVTDQYGRALSSATLAAIPMASLGDPLGLATKIGNLRQDFKGDNLGRIHIREGLQNNGFVLAAPGAALKKMPGLPQENLLRLEGMPVLDVLLKDSTTKKSIQAGEYTLSFAPEGLPWLVMREKGSITGGHYVIAPSQYPCKVEARSQGFVPRTLDIDAPPKDGPLVIYLERGICLSGRVTDSGGVPIAGAYISTAMYFQGVRTESGQDGLFALPPLAKAGAPYTFFVGADGYVDSQIKALPAKDSNNIRVVLRKGAGVTGRLVDADTRQLVQGARAALRTGVRKSSRGESFELSVQPDGSFRDTGFAPGEYELHAYGPSRVASNLSFTITGTELRDLGEIALSAHPIVAGRLVPAPDTDLGANAEIHLERILKHDEVAVASAPTTLEGTVAEGGIFKVEGVAPGRYRFVASDGQSKKVLPEVIVDKEDVQVGDVQLEDSASIHGQLLAHGAENLVGWRVTLMTQAFDFNPPTASSGQDGSFAFEALPAGTYRLAAYEPLSLKPAATQTVVLRPGQQAEVLVPVGGVSLVAFLQVDGTPAPGASVVVQAASGSLFDTGVVSVQGASGHLLLGLPATSRVARADGTGRVEIDDLEPGQAQALMNYNGMMYTLPVIVPAQTAAPVQWNFLGLSLTGEVTSSDGSPAPGAVVSLGYEGIGVAPGTSVRSDASGNFRFSGLGEGWVNVSARSDAGATASIRIQIQAGSQGPVMLQLRSQGQSS